MNRLANERSPYLLQHASNPVDWYPWSEEAFQAARKEDKPIFLSIGYSTCHWCHVMEKESFEDEEVAELLNRYFVSIKVDREERPDIDSFYMTVCQAMTGRGGWPLTIFMTPEKEPFLAATYIPRESRHGMKGLRELIPLIGRIWEERREDLLREAGRITETIRGYYEEPERGSLPDGILDAGVESLIRIYDPEYGGFGQGPKFPLPHNHLFLLRRWYRTRRNGLLEMVLRSVRGMLYGGVHDHIGGGFHRYSTDREWLLPHFEKMLYDQALFLHLFADLYQITADREFLDTIHEMVEFIARDFISPRGGFYSAWDADSEGEEGRFYTWTKREVKDALGEREGELFSRIFHLEDEGNYRDEGTGRYSGRNILYTGGSIRDISERLGIETIEMENYLKKWREVIFRRREERVKPFLDDKILTDWNGLMIGALARVHQVTGLTDALLYARKAWEFLEKEMLRDKGLIFHRWREGRAEIEGFLDDYAFLCHGLIELYLATGEPGFLSEALSLGKTITERFRRPDGGYYMSPPSMDLPVRTSEYHDGALPSGNSVALNNMVRLGYLAGDEALLDQAGEDIESLGGLIAENPSSCSFLLLAVDTLRYAPASVVICLTGKAGADEPFLEWIQRNYLPDLIVHRKTPGSAETLARILPHTSSMKPAADTPRAYLCKGHTCSPPVTGPQDLCRLLQA